MPRDSNLVECMREHIDTLNAERQEARDEAKSATARAQWLDHEAIRLGLILTRYELATAKKPTHTAGKGE